MKLLKTNPKIVRQKKRNIWKNIDVLYIEINM